MTDDDEYLNSLMSKSERTLDDVANDVRKNLTGAVEHIIKAGKHLQEGRGMHDGDREFGRWCQKEFPDLKHGTRNNMMQLAKRFGASQNFNYQTPISVLYELSAPSVPDDLAEGFLSSSEPVKVKDVQEAKSNYKEIQSEPVFEDIKTELESGNITAFEATERVKERKASMPVVPKYNVDEAMGAIKGIAQMYGQQYQGTTTEAAQVLLDRVMEGYDQDDVGMSIARDYAKWFLSLKEVFDLVGPELEDFLADKPNLSIVN
jgi:hypothetical protein